MADEQPQASLPPIDIPAFSGPIDLLLHLIRINEVSITDIPIVEITEQYTAYLDAMRELDLDVASEYVAMAAELIYIKSQMLLPRPARAARGGPARRPRPAACSSTRSSSARPRPSTRSTRCAAASGRRPPRPRSRARGSDETLEVSLFDLIERLPSR